MIIESCNGGGHVVLWVMWDLGIRSWRRRFYSKSTIDPEPNGKQREGDELLLTQVLFQVPKGAARRCDTALGSKQTTEGSARGEDQRPLMDSIYNPPIVTARKE